MFNSSQLNWRDDLLTHPAAELFPRPSEAELKELAEDIKLNGQCVPIAVCKSADGKTLAVVDGVSRLDAMALTGLLNVNSEDELCIGKELVRFTAVTGDPYAFALSANIHRRHLTAELKRDLIEKLLKAKPEQSDRQIAKQTKTSPTWVGKIRKEAEAAGDVSTVDTRIDTRGRKQPSTKPKKAPIPASPAKTDPIGSPPVRYSEVPATSVPSEDYITLLSFTHLATRLRKLIRRNGRVRFANAELSDDDIRYLAKFFADLTKAREDSGITQQSAEVSTEQRTADHAVLGFQGVS
jgi:hypothetical protein